MLGPLDSPLTYIALGAVLFAVVRLYEVPRKTSMVLGVLWGVSVLGLEAFDLAGQRAAAAAPYEHRPLVERSDGYVSSQACQSCHPEQHATWDVSYHSKMTQLPSEETVLAPFAGERLHYVYEYSPYRKGDEFWVATNNPHWAEPGESLPVSRRIGQVTGSHHQQLYWFERPGTRGVSRFQFFYLIREQRWVPFSSAVLSPGNPQIELGQSWSNTCIRCHATHGKPRFDANDNNVMDTRVAELGIGCESCHGPGQKHVEANRSTLRRYLSRWTGRADDTITNPDRLTADRSIEVCGQCHSVQEFGSLARMHQWSNNGMPYRPGDDLGEDRHVFGERPEELAKRPPGRVEREDPNFIEDRFWSDGVVKISGREYHGTKDSPCYASGEFTCTTCHTMHQDGDDPRSSKEWANDQVSVASQGNGACLGCHPGFADPEALEAHSHHAASSSGSSCYNCHMPNTAYGLLKGTRNHFIQSPSASVQLETGRPNACNLCHLDQTLEWTARNLNEWYGAPMPEFLDPEHLRTAEGPLQLLRGDAGQRALAAFHMGWEPATSTAGVGDWAAPLLAELALDPYDAVRFIALRSLGGLPGYAAADLDYLASVKKLRETREKALEIWVAPNPELANAERMKRVLVDKKGERMRARVAELLEQRDDRRVYRAE